MLERVAIETPALRRHGGGFAAGHFNRLAGD
jgi:hypothetical protein